MKNMFLAWVGTAFIGMTGLGIFFRKNISKITKAIRISKDVLDILDEGANAGQDGKLTTEEIQKIMDLAEQLKKDLKGGSK